METTLYTWSNSAVTWSHRHQHRDIYVLLSSPPCFHKAPFVYHTQKVHGTCINLFMPCWIMMWTLNAWFLFALLALACRSFVCFGAVVSVEYQHEADQPCCRKEQVKKVDEGFYIVLQRSRAVNVHHLDLVCDSRTLSCACIYARKHEIGSWHKEEKENWGGLGSLCK